MLFHAGREVLPWALSTAVSHGDNAPYLHEKRQLRRKKSIKTDRKSQYGRGVLALAGPPQWLRPSRESRRAPPKMKKTNEAIVLLCGRIPLERRVDRGARYVTRCMFDC